MKISKSCAFCYKGILTGLLVFLFYSFIQDYRNNVNIESYIAIDIEEKPETTVHSLMTHTATKVINKSGTLHDNYLQYNLPSNLELDSYTSLYKKIYKPEKKHSPGLFSNLSLQVGSTFYDQLKKSRKAYVSGNLPIEDRPKSNLITILLYHPFYKNGPIDWKFGLGTEGFKNANCRIDACSLVADRSYLNTSEAVIFFTPSFYDDISVRNRFPKHKRPPYQKWIVHLMESNIYGWLDTAKYANFYNGTMTFKRHSDIYTPYGHYEKINSYQSNFDPNFNYSTGKKKLIAWFVSHCDTQSKRSMYVSKLMKHIPVDIYGTCGNLRCFGHSKCHDMLHRNYKFYLAFENSLCTDYATEKVWKILLLNVIPIVLGNVAYNEILPPNSYIDVRDFSSPQKLAEYLSYLDKNDTAYNLYFQWKEKYKAYVDFGRWDNNRFVMCNLCEYLHTQRHRTKIYTKPELFWNANDECISPSKFYKNIMRESEN